LISLKDVARAANVSPTTVSAVVNGLDCVKPATRERVLKAIKDLGYIPNISARELVTRKKQNIGLITMVYDKHDIKKQVHSNEMNIFYNDYINEIAETIKSSGYGLLIENFVYKEGSRDLPRIIKEKRVDGAIIVGSLYKEEFIERLKNELDIFVTVGAFTDLTAYVINNYTESIMMAVRYLVKKGHRKIAYVNGDSVTYACSYKLFGYKCGLEESGIDFTDKLVFQGKFLVSEGYEIAKKIYELPKDLFPTAILFGSDILALGANEYFYEKGIRVPDDISLMGYENLIISAFSNPPLTTVDWNKKMMAEKACEIILDSLKTSKIDNSGVVVPCSIIERKSVRNLICQ
jgi:DNA-binding LacI/PurR family transcriptional regulator